jgi:uncharacterized repeat protein (TIGR03803 family)
MKKYLLPSLILFISTISLCYAQESSLWGMTFFGGTDNKGLIFKLDISTGKETDIHDFGKGKDGKFAWGSLTKASDGVIYGMTMQGGVNGIYHGGIIFSYNIIKGGYAVLHEFGTKADGYYPKGSLIQASDGLLYGLTSAGGTYDNMYPKIGDGTIFSYDIETGTYTKIHDFGKGRDGMTPDGSLMQATNGLLYGITDFGGAIDGGDGIIFSYNINTRDYTDVHDFGSGTDGKTPFGSLIQANDEFLYGVTSGGGDNNMGTIFSYNMSTNKETVLHSFGSGKDGKSSNGPLVHATDGLIYGTTGGGGVNDHGTIFSYNISKDTYTKIYDFGKGKDGVGPCGPLTQAANGLLYGMTSKGGAKNKGVIFSYNISTGTENVIYDFTGADGYLPYYGYLLEVKY